MSIAIAESDVATRCPLGHLVGQGHPCGFCAEMVAEKAALIQTIKRFEASKAL